MKRHTITFHSTKDIKPLLNEIQQIIFDRIQKDKNISTLLLLVCGLLNKTYELTETAIWAIENDRPQTATFMLRGLFETLAFTNYAREKVSEADLKDREEVISTFLFGSRKPDVNYKSVNILTCIDRAAKEFTELRKNYDDLSELVHPNSASHFYVASAQDEKERLVTLQIPFYKFKNADKVAALNQIGECCFHIIRISKDLLKIS